MKDVMAPQKITQFFSSTFLNDSPLTKTLGEEFVLSDSGNIVFHWADFFETCDLVKAQLEKSPTLMEDFRARELSLKRLADIPVWIKTHSKIIQSTMFDLYENYILNHLGGVNPFSPLKISFISAAGPFKELSIAECFNKDTYRDFILVYLIKGKLPKRDYRLRLKSKVLAEFGKNFANAELISLEQLTMHGMLLSVDSEVFLKKMQEEEHIRLLVNARMLTEVRGKSLDELKAHLSQYAFNLLYSSVKTDAVTCKFSDFSVQSSFDFAQNRKVYLFISYEKMAISNPAPVKAIREFVCQTKELVINQFIKANEGKLTA